MEGRKGEERRKEEGGNRQRKGRGKVTHKILEEGYGVVGSYLSYTPACDIPEPNMETLKLRPEKKLQGVQGEGGGRKQRMGGHGRKISEISENPNFLDFFEFLRIFENFFGIP
jgi:hypothetical protein